MNSYSSRIVGAVALMAAIAACGGNKGSATSDSAMSSDLQMAGGAATQPGLGDTAAAAKAPAATKPAPAAKPAAERPKAPAATKPAARPTGEVASGTTLLLHPSAKVCTNTNKVGDTMTATLADAVPATNGLSIPAGAVVTLKITALKRSENVKDPIDMGFNPVSVTFGGETYPITATVIAEKIDRIRNEPTSKDVQKVVGGAVVGAIAGKLIGKDTKGAVVGAATGAAAGAAVAATTANFEGCIAQGSDMTIKLSSPVTIH
ncbi:MAG TPA: YMGG-like glycine zipper-containing protein [Gemmatimonadaceae bacterium]